MHNISITILQVKICYVSPLEEHQLHLVIALQSDQVTHTNVCNSYEMQCSQMTKI